MKKKRGPTALMDVVRTNVPYRFNTLTSFLDPFTNECFRVAARYPQSQKFEHDIHEPIIVEIGSRTLSERSPDAT